MIHLFFAVLKNRSHLTSYRRVQKDFIPGSQPLKPVSTRQKYISAERNRIVGILHIAKERVCFCCIKENSVYYRLCELYRVKYLVITVCTDLLYNLPSDQRPVVDKDTFILLARIASCGVLMSTHDGFYWQRDGLAMGSPPAPHFPNEWLNQFESNIKGEAKLYFR